MTAFGLIWRNLWRSATRTWLMILSIAIAFILFGTLFGFSRTLNPQNSADPSKMLIVHNKVNILQSLPIAYLKAVRETPGVESVSYVRILGGYYKERKNSVPTLMVDAESYLAQNADAYVLPPAQRKAFLATRDGIILDEATAKRNGWKVGARITLTSELAVRSDGSAQWPFTLVGVYTSATAEDTMTGGVGHFAYADSRVAFGKDRVHWFALTTKNARLNDSVAAKIDNQFQNTNAATKTEPASAMAQAFIAQVADVGLVIKLIVGAAFVTILLIVGNTLALSIRQRTKELGVMRALGFSSARVASLILGEALLIAGIGAMAGLIAAAQILALITSSLSGSASSAWGLPLIVIMWGGLAALLLGLFTGWLPALRALHIKPAVAFSRS